ncbi:MAG: alpha/beta hydrolase [Brevinemataceae bacterium]
MKVMIFKILGILLFFTSCSLQLGKGFPDTYYVLSDGARLPVYIKGPDTQKVILFVHGGPALSGVLYYYMPFFQELIKHYRVVFWDQRAGGGARGHTPLDTITVNQFVKDMDAVYQSILVRNPDSQIYVMGHSFGGLFGGAYVSRFNDKVKASMFTAPAFDIGDIAHVSSGVALKRIDNLLNHPDISDKTRKIVEKARQFYIDNPVITAQVFMKHLEYVNTIDLIQGDSSLNDFALNNLPMFIGDNIVNYLDLETQTELLILALEKNGQSSINLSTDSVFPLSRITTPMLVVSGGRDLLVPAQTVAQSYKALNGGTPNPNSVYKCYKKGSHHMYLSEFQDHLQIVLDFMAKN